MLLLLLLEQLTIKENKNDKYNLLITQISTLITDAKRYVATAINNTLVETYWNIGKYIVEFEQDGNTRAKYGEQLLVNLSKDLTVQLGKGFSRSNLFNMRLFYMRFPIFQTVSGKLSWSHIIEIVNIDNQLERNFRKFRHTTPLKETDAGRKIGISDFSTTLYVILHLTRNPLVCRRFRIKCGMTALIGMMALLETARCLILDCFAPLAMTQNVYKTQITK
jgi:hypothetical protein